MTTSGIQTCVSMKDSRDITRAQVLVTRTKDPIIQHFYRDMLTHSVNARIDIETC